MVFDVAASACEPFASQAKNVGLSEAKGVLYFFKFSSNHGRKLRRIVLNVNELNN